MPTVRPATTHDVATLVAFNAAMAQETEHRTLDRGRLHAGVANLLADPAKGAYRVAEEDGRVVGCLMLTREWSDWRDGDFWWIQSVYVLPEARGRGVFRALWDSLEREARATGNVAGLRLYVEKDNARARGVYAALGMAETDYRLYELEFTREG